MRPSVDSCGPSWLTSLRNLSVALSVVFGLWACATTAPKVDKPSAARAPIPCVDAARYLGAAYQLSLANANLRGGAEGLFVTIQNAMFKTTLATIIAASEHLQANLEVQGGRYQQGCRKDTPSSVTPPKPPVRTSPTLHFSEREDAQVACGDVEALAEGAADFQYASAILCAATPGVCHTKGEGCDDHRELCDKMRESAQDVVEVLTYRGECSRNDEATSPSTSMDGRAREEPVDALPCPVVTFYGRAAEHARRASIALRLGLPVLRAVRRDDPAAKADIEMTLNAVEQLALGFAQRHARYAPTCIEISGPAPTDPPNAKSFGRPSLSIDPDAEHRCDALEGLFEAREQFLASSDLACQSASTICSLDADSCDDHQSLCDAMRDHLLENLTDFTVGWSRCVED